MKTSVSLLLIKSDISALRRNATVVGAWYSMTSCKQHVFSIQQPKITRRRSRGYRGLQNKRWDRPTIRTLKTKSGMERGISVTSLERKMGLKNRKMNAVKIFPVWCFTNIYTGRKTWCHAFILTFEVEEDEVFKFQIFVQVRIIYIGGFQGKVVTGKRVCDLSAVLQWVFSILEKRKRDM